MNDDFFAIENEIGELSDALDQANARYKELVDSDPQTAQKVAEAWQKCARAFFYGPDSYDNPTKEDFKLGFADKARATITNLSGIYFDVLNSGE